MFRLDRPWILGGLVAAGLALGSGHVQAQVPYVVAPSRTVIVAPGSPTVLPGPPYAAPATRRYARRPGRYTTRRPAYVGRPNVTFAPFSDRYSTRTGAGEAYVPLMRPR